MAYNNTRPVSGFSISSDEQPLARCVARAYGVSHVTTGTCYTAAIAQLRRNQSVFIVNTEGFHRPIITSDNSSFWGIYKIN